MPCRRTDSAFIEMPGKSGNLRVRDVLSGETTRIVAAPARLQDGLRAGLRVFNKGGLNNSNRVPLKGCLRVSVRDL